MKKKLSLKNIILFSIIGVLLTTIIVLSVLLYKKEKTEYYDIKCESFEVQNSNLSPGQIVFIGDSITDLYPLDSYYNDLDLAAYNRGIGGDTTTGVLNRLDVSIFDINPSVIVLMIGINDIDSGRSVEDMIKTYNKIVMEIKNNLPEVKLYCMSIIPQNKDLEKYTTLDVDSNMKKINEANEEIIKICDNYDAVYLDLHSMLLDDENYLDKKYSDDGIHLNANGFVIWTDLLKPYLD